MEALSRSFSESKSSPTCRDRFWDAVSIRRSPIREPMWSVCGTRREKCSRRRLPRQKLPPENNGSCSVHRSRSPRIKLSLADIPRPMAISPMTLVPSQCRKMLVSFTCRRTAVCTNTARRQSRGRRMYIRAQAIGSMYCFRPQDGRRGSGGTNVSVTSTTANVTWNTAVPSDSQVEYGPTGAYGNSTALAADRATAHSVAVNGLSTGTSYHLRVKSRDSDGVLATGGDRTISTIASALPVSISASPLNSTIASGGTQQFTATVSNSSNAAVTWSATTGTISSSGLFTAPKVNTQTSVSITANSQADTSKSATTNLTVSAALPALAVNPMSLSFTGQTGASGLEAGSVSITNTGGGPLSFTEGSDQTWMSLSAGSGTAPSTLQVFPSMTGLKAGTYTGHISVTGGGTTKIVTVNLTVTSPPVQRSVGLSWRASTSSGVVSYSVYRSIISGSSYGLVASAISDPAYVDQTVQSGNKYYYVVTAVNDRGQESAFSTQTSVTIP